MSQENGDALRPVFDSWAKGEFGAPTLPLDEHVLTFVPPDFPEFGVFVGPEGFYEFTRRFLDVWERVSIEAECVEALGDTVLVKVLQHNKGRVSGIEGDFSYFMLFTFRGDKIVRIETQIDEGKALEAVGRSE